MQEKIKNINTLEELQVLYTETFGKNGTMTARLKDMKNLDNDARAALNLENQTLRELFKTRQSEIENAVLMAGLQKQKLDMSLNPEPENRGTLHPLTQSLSEIAEILESFGYKMYTGPEIEDDWHNFTALNTPMHHPARDMQDTFLKTVMCYVHKHLRFKFVQWKQMVCQLKCLVLDQHIVKNGMQHMVLCLVKSKVCI